MSAKNESMGERIYRRRRELEMRQYELARKVGISKGFMSDVENGKRSVGADTLRGLSLALGRSMEWILVGKEWEPTDC